MPAKRVAAMVGVERAERVVPMDAADALIAKLDERPGIWLGSDVEIDGLYARHAVALVDPCIAFSLEGRRLAARALDATGAALLGAAGPREGEDAVSALRRFLAAFDKPSPELAFYGALSWDYFRIADGTLPEDGRRRMLLYFPSRVLVLQGTAAREITFRFSLPPANVPVAVATAAVAASGNQADDGIEEEPPGAHAARVRGALDLLRAGSLYSVVMSRTFRRVAKAKPSDAFRVLRDRNPYPAMFFANLGGEHVFGASPDLQVRADHRYIDSAPVCGTYRRGADPIEDAEQTCALLDSVKEAASLAACADADANDKAAVCEPGSVELVSYRRVQLYPTVVHTIAHLRGRRRAGVDAFDVLFAHAAPATVTGSPKRAAISAIERLESGWRNWYGGAMARLGSDGSCEVLTILRAARMVGAIAEIRTGGSLLADSDPEFEEEETRLKAQTLFSVLAGEWPSASVPVRTGGAFELRAGGDPFAARIKDFLAQCGCRIEAAGIAVVSGNDAGPNRRGVWIGDAALALLEAEGGRTNRLELPMYARLVQGAARDDTALAGLGALRLGLYAARGIREGGLPPGWRVALCSADGWVLAAQDDASRRLAILARPDSILSLAWDSGRRTLLAAYDWIAST